jgi:hypothetical protein
MVPARPPRSASTTPPVITGSWSHPVWKVAGAFRDPRVRKESCESSGRQSRTTSSHRGLCSPACRYAFAASNTCSGWLFLGAEFWRRGRPRGRPNLPDNDPCNGSAPRVVVRNLTLIVNMDPRLPRAKRTRCCL